MALADAGQGVRGTDFVSGFPSGLHMGTSWNRELEHARATALGAEFKAKGVNVLLGPVVGPLGRIALGGRNWEGFSNDPYLSGALVHETVTGAQSSGHFVVNEQELNRNPIRSPNATQVIESSSSNLDDKTMHELYLWPFVDAVKAGTGSIMCSYERINNSYGCHNAKTQNGILNTELGFQGFIVSDWGAQHAGVASALGGLDMVMPSGSAFWAGNLTAAVRNGSVPESRLDDMVTRILAARYQLGQDTNHPTPGFGMPASLTAPHEPVDARDPSARDTILQGAIEGHVLVKNTNSALSLTNPRLLNLFGYDALVPRPNNPSFAGAPRANNSWNLGCSSLDPAVPALLRDIAAEGTVISGGGSGAVTPSYISSPFDAISAFAQEKDIALLWDFDNVNTTGAVVGSASACLVFINAWATEFNDRPNLGDSYSDTLVDNIADQCTNTIVIIHNAGIRLVDAFYDHPNVTAILYAHLPGQDSGNALVEVLFGQQSPSGKLPYTVAQRAEDYGTLLNLVPPESPYTYFPQDDFAEGELIDYRAFDALNITPRFEFGFGLSYTTFNYANIKVQDAGLAEAEQYPSEAILPGGRPDLWDVLASVTVEVTNTGTVEAAEIAQLYLTIPNSRINIPSQVRPVGRQLRGFGKESLRPGETCILSFDLTRRDLSQWDVVA
ncbi:putative beta-glucosidase M-1 [Elsinoe australis]|uniref:beta-glucosidase n=1 Tax=Elsinoe australis TaxID=40998 RepID=A0A4U7B664_9PEZI|nr:putative beta-glucosidase M-1 [Elsinoe australis]